MLRALLGRRPASAAQGAAIVEFALVMPLCLLLLTILFDFGFAAYQAMQVAAAAEAGAAYASRNAWDADAIATVVTGDAAGLISAVPLPVKSCSCSAGGILEPAMCGAACPGGGTAGVYATVSAQAQYRAMLPYPGFPDPLTLSRQVVRRLQ